MNSSSNPSPVDAPGPGMPAQVATGPAGAPPGRTTLEGFLFPELPPEPFPPTADRRPPTQSPDSIVNAALAEAEQIRELARAEGYETGMRAATVEAEERFESAFAAVGEALAQAREMRARTADEVERHAVELALQVAEKALAGALHAQPERVVDVIRGALRCLVERERVVILVSPDDLETAREAVGDLVRALGGIDHCEVQEERRVERGGAIVRSATGEIDATVGTKLERARETLEAELRSSASGAELRSAASGAELSL